MFELSLLTIEIARPRRFWYFMVSIPPLVGRYGVVLHCISRGSYCRCDSGFVFSSRGYWRFPGRCAFSVLALHTTKMASITFACIDAMLGRAPVGRSCAKVMVGGLAVWAPLSASRGSSVQVCLSAGSPTTTTSAKAAGVARWSPPSPSATLGSTSTSPAASAETCAWSTTRRSAAVCLLLL